MIAIYNNEVPTVKADGDIKSIALKIILHLTGVGESDSMVKDRHHIGDTDMEYFINLPRA